MRPSSSGLEVVIAHRVDAAFSDHHMVRLIADEMGHEIHDPADVSLDDKAPGTDTYVREIARVLDAAEYGIDVSRYFL